MLDQFTEKKPLAIETASGPQQVVGFKAATFAWSSADAGGTTTPSRQGFRLRIENELLFKENAINLIIGKLVIMYIPNGDHADTAFQGPRDQERHLS